MVAMGSENPLWESANNFKSPLQVAVENFPDVVEQCSGYLKHSTSSYNYARTEIRVRRHANQKISINTRLLLKIKTVQTVFPSGIRLNCHLDKKNFFFIKSQILQKLFKNDGKTFQRSPTSYIFINWSNYVHNHDKYFLKTMKKCNLGSLIFTHHGR